MFILFVHLKEKKCLSFLGIIWCIQKTNQQMKQIIIIIILIILVVSKSMYAQTQTGRTQVIDCQV